MHVYKETDRESKKERERDTLYLQFHKINTWISLQGLIKGYLIFFILQN